MCFKGHHYFLWVLGYLYLFVCVCVRKPVMYLTVPSLYLVKRMSFLQTKHVARLKKTTSQYKRTHNTGFGAYAATVSVEMQH